MKFNVLLMSLLMSMACFGQQLKQTNKVNVQWGEDIKMKKTSYYGDVLLATKSKIFMTKWDKGNMSIEVFDSEMQSIKEQTVDLTFSGKKDVSLEGIVPFGKNFVLLGSYSDKKTKKNTLYYKTISQSSLGAKTNWEEVASMTFEKKRRDGSFNYRISDDSSKILLYYDKPYKGKDAPESFGFMVFNDDMKMIWEKDVELDFDEGLFSILNYKLSNEGDVYIVGREYKGDIKAFSKATPGDRKYHILAYQSKGSRYKDYKVDLDDKYITDIAFAINKGELVCAGFYSENGTNSIKGTYYLTINQESGKVTNSTFKEIGEDFITQDWSDRAIKKAKKKEEKKGKAIEAYEFDLRDFVIKEDGGAVLLAEQYYVRVVTTTTTDANGNTTTKTTYHYYYNDVYIIDIDKNGGIDWISKIDKYQHSINDGGFRSSYALQVKGDKLYLMYNLVAKHYYDKEQLKMMSKKEKKAYLTFISEVNGNGDVEDEVLINNSEEETYMIPKFCEQIDSGRMLLYTAKGKNKRMGIAKWK